MRHTFIFLLSCLLIISIFPTSTSASYGWGYNKSTNNQPPKAGKYGDILEENGSYYIDQSGDKEIYLTFDNGYEEGYTEQVLDVLKEKDVPATFFVTGHYVTSNKQLMKRMVKEGHIVGNHTYHHPDLTTISKQEMKQELDSLEDAVAEVTDQNSMKYVRPPKGTFSEQSLQWANELGYIHMFWSLTFVDWNTNSQQGWQRAYKKVVDQLHPGAVILLHTVSKDNAEALEHLIDDIRQRGYTFKSLDHLVMKDMVPTSLYGM
ncbi:delta-lactam-biosynthetic de-N-acetylase [Aquibacillus sediminis]|uniref:delta-lactam-biosynthetic de-N-acetylase n=1 Tax=Aquibacillus sediminis TaxID=2574734 RepID=UPI001107CBF3|nr:delta-lactam-biosynthetic de-N-acetylase [Aquibacillus sediminis]